MFPGHRHRNGPGRAVGGASHKLGILVVKAGYSASGIKLSSSVSEAIENDRTDAPGFETVSGPGPGRGSLSSNLTSPSVAEQKRKVAGQFNFSG